MERKTERRRGRTPRRISILNRLKWAAAVYAGLFGGALAVGVMAVPSTALAASGPAAAFTQGCQGQIQSYSSSGALLDTLVAPGTPSANNPFVVDPSGTVRYGGATDAVITNYTWHISAWGIPLLGGSGSNSGGQTSTQGVEPLSHFFGNRLFTGVVYVSGAMTGGGTCQGYAWIQMEGSPVGTPGWLAGLVLGILGVLGIIISFPQATGPSRPSGGESV